MKSTIELAAEIRSVLQSVSREEIDPEGAKASLLEIFATNWDASRNWDSVLDSLTGKRLGPFRVLELRYKNGAGVKPHEAALWKFLLDIALGKGECGPVALRLARFIAKDFQPLNTPFED